MLSAMTSTRLSIRVDISPECSIGPGKIALLEAIMRDGSLSQAARSLGMSYRRAWVLVDELNRSLAEPAVATATGGTNGGGAEVTGFGRALVAAYRGVERDATRRAEVKLAGFAASQAPVTRGTPRRRSVSK
jgi:molybdate transport system regulatory protein